MIALRLKEEFNLNPLLVTCSPMIPSEVGMHNREEVLKVGFDQGVRPSKSKSSTSSCPAFLH